eukprot:g6813.t1
MVATVHTFCSKTSCSKKGLGKNPPSRQKLHCGTLCSADDRLEVLGLQPLTGPALGWAYYFEVFGVVHEWPCSGRTDMSKRRFQTWEDRQGAKKKFKEKARSALGFSAPSPMAASCGTSSTQPSSLNLPASPAHFSHPPSWQESKESCVVLHSVRGDVQDGLHIAFQEAKKSQVRKLGTDSFGLEYYLSKFHPSHDRHIRSGTEFVERVTVSKVYDEYASFPVYYKQILPAIASAIRKRGGIPAPGEAQMEATPAFSESQRRAVTSFVDLRAFWSRQFGQFLFRPHSESVGQLKFGKVSDSLWKQNASY